MLALLAFLNTVSVSKYNLAQITEIDIDTLLRWRRAHGLRTALSLHASGPNVGLLQHILSSDRAIYPERKITNYYGALTQNAIRRFQKEYDLPQTGIADILTINQLNKIFFVHLCPQSTAAPSDLLRQVDERVLLPADYVPPFLVDISDVVKTTGVVCVRKDIVPYVTQMFLDAKKDGIDLAVTSGYRSPEVQQYLYIRTSGAGALKTVARPGASEHQLGTAVDLTDALIGYAGADDRFAFSAGGMWLAANAHRYGFIMSYPRGREHDTGYKYEPWHWRFVGYDAAEKIYREKLFSDEFPADPAASFQ